MKYTITQEWTIITAIIFVVLFIQTVFIDQNLALLMILSLIVCFAFMIASFIEGKWKDIREK
jgi:hypothetical protein